MNQRHLIVYTDGGSRGNPGPASIGVLICDDRGKEVKKYGQAIGKATNNQAEYQAAIFALKKIKSLIGKKKIADLEVEVRSDSELLVSQLSGKYKILDENIQKLFILVWNLKIDYKKVNFALIPREENQEADKLVNEALDQEGRTRRLI
ncbi:ribonuclease HI family protein [Candidatus Parcubacteria bacterium]|nr:ribonuclease HI family protein [Patescibacteria group bacterium]MBU4466946.1 ribonuclease HI family protein [Patescibacteria group bacterium]MCG2688523.1 ribonuclease HI family protein [Candidatus Parcubacteria bacterium]